MGYNSGPVAAELAGLKVANVGQQQQQQRAQWVTTVVQ